MSKAFALAGGALFAAALAFCAWTYLMVWNSPDVHVTFGGRVIAGPTAAGIDILLFSLFAVHHSLFARGWVKRALAYVLSDALIRPMYVWTASLLLIVACAAWVPIGGELYHHTGVAGALHTTVQLAGVWLTGAAAGLIDPLELAGIRQPTPDEPLQTGGPYRWVRHPIYLGWALMAFGAAQMTTDRFLFAVMTTAYLVIAIPWEERSLGHTFGERYRAYRQRVRWRLIPYVY
jgi:protein-S-isoprenylcysteine O-methyltransferase Ste14